jgi:hypothetical protein
MISSSIEYEKAQEELAVYEGSEEIRQPNPK